MSALAASRPRATLGTINHLAITVSDLDRSMRFLQPMLEFLGFVAEQPIDYAGTRVSLCINPETQIGFNVWEAKGELADHKFEVYAPGLHHVALNADTREQVDKMADLVRDLGGTILDGPDEFPFADRGYYAVYFLGPDGLKFEFVHMQELTGGADNNSALPRTRCTTGGRHVTEKCW